MLIGEYQHSLDAKGRIFIPSKFRDELGERFIVTRGIGVCLFGMSLTEWEALSQKLRALPITDVDALRFLRLFFAGAAEVSLDPQGRILLPANLRQIAKLEKDAVVTGTLNRIEIWSKSEWANYTESAEAGFDETLMKMAQLGI